MSSLLDGMKVGLRRVAKASLAYAIYSSGLLDQLSAYGTSIKGGRRIIILGYHRIVKDFHNSSEYAIPALLTSEKIFKQHIDLIYKKYNFISLDDALEALSEGYLPKRDSVVLTFDDGYQDFYTVAFPILRRYSLPATLFVPTGLIGKTEPLAHDQIFYLLMEMIKRHYSVMALLEKSNLIEPLTVVRSALAGHRPDYYRAMRALFEMPRVQVKRLITAMKNKLQFSDDEFPVEYRLLDWSMLGEIIAAGLTIGAHTRNHPLLTAEPQMMAECEIFCSKAELEYRLGISVRHFAYPDGRYNANIVELVKQAGFQSACTTEDRPNLPGENPYQLKRKLLWERACLGIFSNFSRIVAECQLRGLFSNKICKRQSDPVNCYE
ncbi:MAG: polysaccharide deacetylase family protein [Acidobacteriota bacterium]